jgi:two-component system, chemotaxis family, CheB/CheR fusion protein
MANTRLVVGLGASAGGLNAFKAFFSHMPPASGMAFVVVQHLSPQHKSMLVELVRTSTSMPVEEAADGVAMRPDHVYVIPPDATLTIQDGALHVVKPAPPREHRHPIDTLFASLAEDQGERAVCIILSGAGSDGTLGLRSIKEHGGFSLAQAEADDTALAGMPKSAAATGLIDFVMRVEEMPDKLLQYLQHLDDVSQRKGSDGSRGDIEEQLGEICGVIHRHLGHDFAQYKSKTLVRRVQRRMQLLQIDHVAKYLERLRKEADERTLLDHDFLIGVTEFFRDPEAFMALASQVIPKILSDRAADEAVRVWVAGCAAGEEAYSIAILLKEEASRREASQQMQLFATDLDEQAINVARSGHCRPSISEALTQERLERWFVKEGDGYSVAKAIREMCIFSIHNILKDPPFSKLDLICCRNLLIYLNPPAQARALQSFHYALRPGGYLFLGSSESVSRQTELFNAVDKKNRIFQRSSVAGALPLPSSSGAPAVLSAAPIVPRSENALDRLTSRIVGKYAPAYLLIDQNDQIVRFFGQTGKYLEPTSGAATLNLFHILRQELRPPARLAIQQARATHRTAEQEDLVIGVNGSSLFLKLLVEPLPDIPSDGMTGLCLVLFQDQPGEPATVAARTDAPVRQPMEVAHLQRELDALRQQLNSTVLELETSNEELKSSNEEFQSINEELQSTNEELETAKEELQSVNEELHTVNTELNSRNEALARVNSDLRNFLDSTEIAMLFLDAELRIRAFTPAMTGLLRLREGDRGRPVTDLVTRLAYDDLASDARAVLRDLVPIEREVGIPGKGGSRFLLRIRPYRTVDNTIDGVVMTFFVGVTGRKPANEPRSKRPT